MKSTLLIKSFFKGVLFVINLSNLLYNFSPLNSKLTPLLKIPIPMLARVTDKGMLFMGDRNNSLYLSI